MQNIFCWYFSGEASDTGVALTRKSKYHTHRLHSIKMCGIMLMGDKMIINAVIKKEAIRNLQMIAEYEALLAQLPKGTLIIRKDEYYYLKYREAGKVCDKYIGKDPQKVSELKEQLEQRKHYEKMLASLRQEQKAIQHILEGLK